MTYQKSPLSPEQRFWLRVSPPDSDQCWVWTGYVAPTGYGQFSMDSKRPDCAHRIAYRLLKGEIAKGLTVDHLCRFRRCVNPDHMELVTRGENTLRGNTITAANTRKTHCSKGHPYSGENLIIKAEGFRRCRQCHADWNREYMRARYREKKNAAA